MAKWQYSKGLHDIGHGCFAYLQPDGGWGWSNAGLITDGEASLLVDTLFDLKLTADMLKTMRDAVPQAKHIGTLVNTHANGDHTFGNELVKGAKIIASNGTNDEFSHVTPAAFKTIMDNVHQFGKAGEFVLECFRPFDFSGITLTPPDETFSGEMEVTVGSKKVRLIEVGPAHTKGDTLVYIPSEKILYTGDILFHGGTPISWAGPMSNWVKALDKILALDVDVVVPGHGGITDKGAVRDMRGYLIYVTEETRKRYDKGMSVIEASFDIALGDYAHWGDAERLVVNVQTLYDEFSGHQGARDPIPFFEHMKALREKLDHDCATGACGHKH